MKLSLSVRIAETSTNKERLAMPFPDIVRMARESGYAGLCLRGSVVSVTSPAERVMEISRLVRASGLAVSMITGDVALAANDEHATDAIRNITPYLDLAEALGTKRVRVMMRAEADIPHAQRAADEANERGLLLCHQTHARTLFERSDECIEVVRRVNRRNFGITYEPANLLICGDDYGPAEIERLGSLIFNVYLQNYSVADEGSELLQTNRGVVRVKVLPLGDRRGVDLDRVFEGLRAIGYDGWVTVHSAMVPGLEIEASASQYYRLLAEYAQ